MSNDNIFNHDDRKDRQGLLGKAVLIQNVITKICESSKFTNGLVTTINVVNTSTEIANITLWVSSSKEPELIDLIEYELSLDPKATFVRNTVILGKDEKLFALSNKNNVVIRADGYDNRNF